jgi:hypothetical protein
LITLAGLVLGVGGSALYLYQPRSLFFLLPVAGAVCFAFGASLLPALFARFAASHYLYVLPYGRAKLLVSAIATIALIALFATGIVVMYYYRTPLALDLVFQRALAVTMVTASLLYVVVWLTGRSGGPIGLLVGSFVTIVTLVVPLRFIMLPSTSLAVTWTACALLWGAFATAFLLAPRLKTPLGRMRHAFAGLTGSSYRGGGEIDFLIGTARPWTVAAGQTVPVAIATYFMSAYAAMTPAWVFFLTIISVTSGAVATLAATRSRALWLRTGWTRAELFRHVESSFWRYNCCTLGVLLLLLVGIGDYIAVPTRLLAFGMSLLALGTALSTYVGLIVTARIGLGDAALAVTAMLALMAPAVYLVRPTTPTATIWALVAGLGVLTLILRELARHRWGRLDWMLCRPDIGVRASA